MLLAGVYCSRTYFNDCVVPPVRFKRCKCSYVLPQQKSLAPVGAFNGEIDISVVYSEAIWHPSMSASGTKSVCTMTHSH